MPVEYTEWKGNKCHPFNSRAGRLKGPKNVYTLWDLNLIVFSEKGVFYSLLFRDASTSLVISRLGSLGVYQKAVYFYCCVVNVSFVKFTDFLIL